MGPFGSQVLILVVMDDALVPYAAELISEGYDKS